MVRITEELVRKKSEHNEGIIGTLEELSLHQEDVEKIEHLHNWCKELQILYLQANIIPKIENLNKLKQLQYLNLAINNIEKIENLERCESLEKLDLTLNFVGDLESVRSLKSNVHLKELYLTGNPCCDFEGYREYVVAQLPQLRSLDLKEISRSERIRALQVLPQTEKRVRECQERYKLRRREQIERVSRRGTSRLSDEDFWKASSENCPETRTEIARRQKKSSKGNEETAVRKSVRLFSKDGGRPLNVNQARLNFTFNDEDPKRFVLDLAIYKFLDSNLIEVDLQPIYVKVTIKGKIFQIVFPEEVLVERSTAQRSQTTGHLVLRLPKANYKPPLAKEIEVKEKKEEEGMKREFLEVEPKECMDFSKIVENNNRVKDLCQNPEIPPLEYF